MPSISAAQTGKAIARAAKGAACRYLTGAAAGALWASRKHLREDSLCHFGLIAAARPVYPHAAGLDFGGLINAFTPDDPTSPIFE